jgi:hypothetical protein
VLADWALGRVKDADPCPHLDSVRANMPKRLCFAQTTALCPASCPGPSWVQQPAALGRCAESEDDCCSLPTLKFDDDDRLMARSGIVARRPTLPATSRLALPCLPCLSCLARSLPCRPRAG